VLRHPFGKKRLFAGAFFVAKIAGDESVTNSQPCVSGEDHVRQSRLWRDQMNFAKFGKRYVQLFPLLLNDRRFRPAGNAHPRIDLVLNPVVIRWTQKQLAHRTENLLVYLGSAQAIGEFPKKWFDVCDEANGLQWLPLHCSFNSGRIDINANGLHVVCEEGAYSDRKAERR
jgi:hypothetical protein